MYIHTLYYIMLYYVIYIILYYIVACSDRKEDLNLSRSGDADKSIIYW